MKLTMLGTGNALVTKCYNTCFILEEEKKQYFLVDTGGGNTVLTRLEQAGIDWHDVKHIFITHKHIDHMLGAIWLIRIIGQNMGSGKYEGDVNIYAHDEVIALLTELCNLLLQKKVLWQIGTHIHFITLKDGETHNIIGHDVTFFDIHSGKDKQFGFSMDLGNGEKLTCCGDEPYAECEYEYVVNSKWLLHEAFCLHGEADIFHPYEKSHSTVRNACWLAQQLHVSNLILYHTEDKNLANRKELYAQEGRAYYKGNLYIPDDLESIEIL